MDYKKLGLGLGLFSIGLGAAELLAARRITRALQADGNEGIVRAFGLRELVAGLGLMQAPAHSTRVWNRVAGDALDLGALGLLARKAPRNGTLWGAVAFVVGAAAVDAITAIGLDRRTGSAVPGRT